MRRIMSLVLVVIMLTTLVSPAFAAADTLELSGEVGVAYTEPVLTISSKANQIKCSLDKVKGNLLLPVVKDLSTVISTEGDKTVLCVSFTGARLGKCELDFNASYKENGTDRTISKHIVIEITDEKIEAAEQAISSKVNDARDAASTVAQQTKEAATAAAQNIGEKASETANKAGEIAKDAAQDISEKANDAAQDISNAAAAAGEKATEVAGVVSEKVQNAREHLRDAVSKIDLSVFYTGWDYASKYFGSVTASMMGQQYVSSVSTQIEKLNQSISQRASQYANNPIASKAGFLAEDWHAGTYNIDAAVKGNKLKAKALGENISGGADIVYTAGEKEVGQVGAKYYKTAEKSADAQKHYANIYQKYTEYCNKNNSSISIDDFLMLDENSDIFWSVYKGQQRLIPADQINDARNYLQRLVAKESAKDGANRQKLAASYKETLDNLTDRLKTADGSESISLTKEEAEALAELSKDNDFKASEWAGITAKSIITPQYIVKQSIRSGATAAAIQSALVLGPQIYQIVVELVRTGELNEEQLKAAGISGLSAAGEGFLEGFVSNALLVMCQAGKFGPNCVKASPELIGTMTVIVINAAKYGYALSKGEITAAEYADIMAEDIITSSVAIGAGMLLAALLPGVPLIYFAGSIAGAMIASYLYDKGKKAAFAVIEDSDFDVVVLIDEKESEMADLVQLGITKVSDAVDNLKNLSKTAIEDVEIVLYDAT